MEPNQTLLDKINGETLQRTARLQAVPIPEADRADGEGAEQYRFELSFSSEDPYERWFGMEILGHKKGEINLEWMGGGTAPLLLQHDHDQVIGVIEKAWIAERRGKAQVRFGKGVLASEIRQDVVDGIRTNVSVGYRVHKMVLTEQSDEGPDTYRVTEWEPLETSIVSIPADKTVGVGRSNQSTKKENTTMSEKAENTPDLRIIENAKAEAARDAVKTDRKRRQDLLELASAHEQKIKGVRDKAESIYNADGTAAELQNWILERYAKNDLINLRQGAGTDGEIGLNDKEIKRFSFLKAIRSQIPGDTVDAGFEVECSRATAKLLRKDPQGLWIPEDVRRGTQQQRDLTVAGTGSNIVATNLLADQYIDVLRNRLAVEALGATVLTGLTGDIAIPKSSAAGTAYWVTEGNAITESQLTLTQVTGTPHTVGGLTDVSRKTIIQGTPDVEQLIRNDLVAVVARAVDTACFVGSGAAGQPLGILGTSGVNNPTVTTGTPTYAQILDFIGDIMTDNADLGSMKWCMTPEVMVKLAATIKHATAAGGFVLDLGTQSMLGYPYVISLQVGANSMFFGVWSQLILALWSGQDLLVDPYTGGNAGTVRIRVLQDCDVLIRHGQSFAYDDAVTS